MELHYKSFGEGMPLLILHGLFGTSDNWQTIGKKLAEDYTVFLIDLRNHGRSPHHPEHTFATMAEDLLHFMEKNWVFKAHMLGHSMGGKTAMHFALHHTDMVEKLVVVDIGPKQYTGGHEDIFRTLIDLDLGQLDDRKEAEAFLEKRISDVGVRQFLLKNLTRHKDGRYEWKMNLPVLWDHYDDILASIESPEPFEGPALFIRGGRSRYIEDADWPGIKAYFPSAQLATIPNAGHWVHAEQPAALLEAVREFLAV